MRTVPAGALLALVLAAALSACGDDGTDGAAATSPTSPSAPTAATSTPAGPGADPTGRVRMEPGLPADFPTADVPLYDAEVIGGIRGETGGVGWSVVLKPTGDPRTIATRAASLLEAAGFTRGPGTAQPRLQVLQYSDADYVVGVTVVLTNDGTTMTYTVSRKQ